jgi:hypothetical protein
MKLLKKEVKFEFLILYFFFVFVCVNTGELLLPVPSNQTGPCSIVFQLRRIQMTLLTI